MGSICSQSPKTVTTKKSDTSHNQIKNTISAQRKVQSSNLKDAFEISNIYIKN